MSETRERTVAKIIGWRRGPDVDLDWGHLYTKPGPGRRRIIVQPTDEPQVDDMLAWLIALGWTPESRYDTVNGHHTALIWRVGQTIRRDAPTLHAALEAAVRAVAEAEGDAG